MRIFIFLLWVVSSDCGTNKESTELLKEALVVVRPKNVYELARPKYVWNHPLTFYFPAPPKKKKTYHLCPENKKGEPDALYIAKTTKEESSTENICSEMVKPVIIKVFAAKDYPIKSNLNIELFHVGFKIKKDESSKQTSQTEYKVKKEDSVSSQKEQISSSSQPLKCVSNCLSTLLPSTSNANKQNQNDDDVIEYKAWNEDFQLIPLVSIYIDGKINQTKTVRYTLVAWSEMHVQEKYQPLKSYDNLGMQSLINLKKFFDSNNVQQFLKDTLKKNYEYYFIEKGQTLVSALLASPHHFLISTWRSVTEINENAALIWEVLNRRWLRIDQFIKNVAEKIGDLIITVGTAGVLQLRNSDSKLQNLSFADSNTSFIIPMFLWKVIEYEKAGEIYGIIVVLHNNPFWINPDKICKKDICEENGWKISTKKHKDFKKGYVYCCEMTAENLNRLEANYLMFQSRKILNINERNVPGVMDYYFG